MLCDSCALIAQPQFEHLIKSVSKLAPFTGVKASSNEVPLHKGQIVEIAIMCNILKFDSHEYTHFSCADTRCIRSSILRQEQRQANDYMQRLF